MGQAMNIEVITSFNQKYYDLIGKDCVSSWLEYWPKKMSLTCYVEEMTLPEQTRVRQVSFDQLPKGYFEFQEAEVKPRVKTFSKKAWSVIHAMFNSTADWIVWVDSDVLTIKPISAQLLDKILPNHTLSTYMGVVYTETKDGRPGNWLVPETGIFAVNTQHPKFDEFRTEYRRHYLECDSAGLRRFYDNDVFGAVITKVSAEYNDLCKQFTKPYKTPLKHTILGKHLHHYKAKHSKDYFSQLIDDQ
jgi:hypothetical protein